jgi:hypothetical protein
MRCNMDDFHKPVDTAFSKISRARTYKHRSLPQTQSIKNQDLCVKPWYKN